MRDDMAKVIVERPRLKAWSVGKRRPDAWDNAPKQKGLLRGHKERGGFKTLNENLAPLRRYLERQVGRPWNNVYSEICRGLRPTSAVQQHVRDHLKGFVELHPQLDAPRTFRLASALWLQPFYVDPVDGLLKRTADTSPEKFAARLARR